MNASPGKREANPRGAEFTRLSDLLSLGEEAFEQGDFAQAVGLAQMAARYAFPCKGCFVSPRLERLLLKLGKEVPVCARENGEKNGGQRRRVLHVLSHARPIGGDSRFVWRWIQRDGCSQHWVAVTDQKAVEHLYPFPKELEQAASENGGAVFQLQVGSPFEQAAELRALCQKVQLIVLHTFPYDVIPILALAAGCDQAKVILVNHSDHTFWTGGSVAHLVVQLRIQPAGFLENRRGLDPDGSVMLPIPLLEPIRRMSRTAAKRALGYSEEKLILLTIATPFKFSAPGQVGFLELVMPVLERFPNAILMAVGPEPAGAWRLAAHHSNGRVLALGTRWENDLLYAAADLYLDSVPFSSITSLLEAGSHGLPLLGYQCQDCELRLLGPGAPGLDQVMELAVDPQTYRLSLMRFLKDAALRNQAGEIVRTQIYNQHIGEGWRKSLESVYARVEQSDGSKCLRAQTDAYEDGELNRNLQRLYSGMPFEFGRLTREFLGSLPFRSRVRITLRLREHGLGLGWLNFLPPPVDAWIVSCGRRVRGIWRKLASAWVGRKSEG